MEKINISKAPLSLKIALSGFLCVIGVDYLSLLYNIWIDTQMKVSLIMEAYCKMEYGELAEHTVKYLPYYYGYIFLVPIMMFMFSSYEEKIKRFFSVFPLIMIITDIGSMWLIPCFNPKFAYLLWVAGTSLGLSFLTLFLMLIYDIWFRKENKTN